ncbi:hypothetical protein MPLSOD_10435 [Mesorhizobium sp. SOD10]|nr:hypothetical protein MPLSOD_10435 [Mesorhizobium sp. SOD10]
MKRPWLGPSAGDRQAGIFITHVLNDRIRAHFDRLRHETEAIIDWQFAYNPWTLSDLVAGRGDFEIDRTSVRVRQAMSSGNLSMGYMDIVLFPLAKSANREFVWVLEYDVDFAGRWLDFFQQFSNNGADLLATTLNTRRRDRRWTFWGSANGPCPKSWFTRAFMPIMRVSRRLMSTRRRFRQANGAGTTNSSRRPLRAFMVSGSRTSAEPDRSCLGAEEGGTI